MLAILTTHPIQYQVPVWKGLAARGNVPFKVFYMSDQGLEERFDPGFGKSLSWDIDLLGNYQCEFLDTYRGTPLDSFWRLRLKRGFGRALRQVGANVLWIQGWQVVAYWQAVFEARRAGTEVWLRGETNARSNADRIGRQFKRLLLRQLLRRVDRFLYIGEANRQFYLDQGIASERLAAAPYCVDNVRFAAAAAVARAERDRIRQEWGIPTESFCFLFAGKFLPKKRPFDLIEAARCLQHSIQGKKIHLLWVGTGELGDELRRACNVCFDAEAKERTNLRRHGAPNASFVGFLNQSEISRAYVAADCLVLPSDARETWGLVVNEAMASGLPCVVSDGCGCVEDLITPIRPDLCYPVGEITALERAMAAAITDTPPLQLLRGHISKYDVSKTIDAVESLYLERTAARSNRNLSHETSKTNRCANSA
ncbi:MAG: glycosyltransferase family 4 protein [Xanthobacteraceae bacterium]